MDEFYKVVHRERERFPEQEPNWDTPHYQNLREALKRLGYNRLRSIGNSIHYWWKAGTDPQRTQLRVFAYDDSCAVLATFWGEDMHSNNWINVTGSPDEIVKKLEYYFGDGNLDW